MLSVVTNTYNKKTKGPIINPLNAELNPICHLLALLGAHLILYVSRVKVNGIVHSHRKTEKVIFFYN
jgi:hypothetical protein